MFNQITLEYVQRFQIAADKAVYTVFVNILVLKKVSVSKTKLKNI